MQRAIFSCLARPVHGIAAYIDYQARLKALWVVASPETALILIKTESCVVSR